MVLNKILLIFYFICGIISVFGIIPHFYIMLEVTFRVSFKNNPKSYTYSADKVVWLTNPQWIVPELCKVYRGGRLQTDVTEIWQFEAGQSNYWRIKYRSGYEGEYAEGQINEIGRASCRERV